MVYKIVVPNYIDEYCWRMATAVRLVDYYLSSGAHSRVEIWKFDLWTMKYKLESTYYRNERR